ncbi:MAG: hypothetical protein QM747_05205 [Nocardioides sp.]
MPGNEDTTFSYRAYSLDAVKEALQDLFLWKCAYCEWDYSPGHPVDVEHYRPKGRIVDGFGNILRPGYYWLAATWENLLPSCIDCNRKRKHLLDDGKKMSGKADAFPLLDETKRAKLPGDEVHEEPMLLNPCEDDVEECFIFEKDGVVLPAAAGGKERVRALGTIDLLGLDRPRLVRRREDRSIVVRATLQRVRDVLELVDDYPDEPRLAHQLERELVELRRLLRDEAEFVTMARQLAQRELDLPI